MNNPYLNAVTAFVYILGVASFLQWAPPLFKPEIAVLGVASILSLLVFSVALMSFLFFFRPLILAIEMEFTNSAWFFGKTVATFAACTIFLVLLVSLF